MPNKRTCLYDKHVSLGALISPFGGFDMPIQYADIVTEHNAVRRNVGVFDVSHMGEVTVTGPDAEAFVNYIFTNDITDAPLGKIYYGMMLYETGGVVDDLLVYKRGANDFFLVINAGNIDKDVAWIEEQARQFQVTIDHQSDYYGQLAVQGPRSEEIVEKVLQIPCSELAFYTFKTLRLHDEDVIVSRTGYTGEDGFEIYASHTLTRRYWDQLIDAGVQPCGLGCRDTLRFEVGLPLYGDELSEDISPIMAGLGLFVKPDKGAFIGRDAIVAQKANGVTRKLVGIELHDKAIPRHGYKGVFDGQEIGEVTTGYHTISTDKSVCMALIDTAHAALGTAVEIQIRKKTFPGTVVKKRFYEKNYHK
ncbi:MAG: glycine cleavage system aminomethyltransferase GcvT [Bacteroidaceae bacterium]|nr:glycine cleavage system aminomethyltransferase GcvT [Bacteroidaceae bacterium]